MHTHSVMSSTVGMEAHFAAADEALLPVNPDGRFGDRVWAKVMNLPRPPYTHENPTTGEVKDFAYLLLPGCSVPKLCSKSPDEDAYRPHPPPIFKY